MSSQDPHKGGSLTEMAKDGTKGKLSQVSPVNFQVCVLVSRCIRKDRRDPD